MPRWWGVFFLWFFFQSVLAWSHQGLWDFQGAVVCDAANGQNQYQVMADGNSGVVVAWHDNRTGPMVFDIYAQRLSPQGQSLWTADGLLVCDATNAQYSPVLALGTGGVVMVWQDSRSGSADLYAQKITLAGIPQWAPNGVPVCTAANDQREHQIASDGAGGLVAVWVDTRTNPSNLYAQRLDAAGNTLWAENGVLVCNAADTEYFPKLLPDLNGGGYCTWYENRVGNTDIFMQRLNGSGTAQWAANGIGVCSTAAAQIYPVLASDGAGGSLVAWLDRRSGNYDIYAQRVAPDGTLLWAATGVPVCLAAGDQGLLIKIVADGAGGAILAWADERSGAKDIYAQRLNAAGASQWTVNGVPVCTAVNAQDYPEVASDGLGGVWVVWTDSRTGLNKDIYIQRLDSAGVIMGPPNGMVLCDLPSEQDGPKIAPDGVHGSISVWWDGRYAATYGDLFGQRVTRAVPEPDAVNPGFAAWGAPTGPLTATGSFFQDDLGQVTYAFLSPTAGVQPLINDPAPVVASASTLTCRFDLTPLASASVWNLYLVDNWGQTSTTAAVLQVVPPLLQTLTWINSPVTTLTTGSVNQLLGQINCAVQGYDQLVHLEITNLGTAQSSLDLQRISLWHQPGVGGGGVTFDPGSALQVGELTPGANKRWSLATSLQLQNQHALYVTADIAGSGRPGQTCQFALPSGGAVFTQAGAYPGFIASTQEQVIVQSVSFRIELQSPGISKVLRGQTRAELARVGLTPIGATSIAISALNLNLEVGGAPAPWSAVASRLWLEQDGREIAVLSPSTGNELVWNTPAVLTPGTLTSLNLRGDLKESTGSATLKIIIADGLCLNQGRVLAEPSPGQLFPLSTIVQLRAAEPGAVFSAYPNPFNPDREPLRVSYLLREAGTAEIEVRMLDGRKVCGYQRSQEPGVYEWTWDGRNERGNKVKSGAYHLRLRLKYSSGGQEVLNRRVAVYR